MLPSCTARHHPGFAAFSIHSQSTGCGEYKGDEHCPKHSPYTQLPHEQEFASRKMFFYAAALAWVATVSPRTITSVPSCSCLALGVLPFPKLWRSRAGFGPELSQSQILYYGCLSMDYVSEVNSHVAKLLLLWEPLVLKSLTSVYKIRACSVYPQWLLPVTQGSSCAAISLGEWQLSPSARRFLDKHDFSH